MILALYKIIWLFISRARASAPFWRSLPLAEKIFAGYLQLHNISENAKFNLHFVRIWTEKTSSSTLKSAQHNQGDVPFYSEIRIDSKCEAIRGNNNQNKKIIIK